MVWILLPAPSHCERSTISFPPHHYVRQDSNPISHKALEGVPHCGHLGEHPLVWNVIKTPEGTRVYPKVSLVKTYREGDEFKSTTSLGRDDLPVAALLLQQAWTAIISEETGSDSK